MTDRTSRVVRVRVPCSTSNLGAGFDCLGLALDRYLEASFEPGGTTFRLERTGTLATLSTPVDRDLLVDAFLARFLAAGIDPRGVLHATSDIPVGRGLGSSAAAVVAGLALSHAVGRNPLGNTPGFRVADVLPDAIAREGHADNVGPALLGGLVAVWPLAGDAAGFAARRLALSPSIGFAFAAPGAEVETAAARATLPASVPHRVAVRSLARVVALIRGLAEGEEESLRAGFEDELHVPHRLALIPNAVRAIEAAREAGAWAATISGSGSGLIAVGRAGVEADVAAAMRDALGENEGAIGFPVHPAEHGTELLEDGR